MENDRPDLSKQAQGLIFSRKTVEESHHFITFNTVPVPLTTCQKHLGLYLNEKLCFSDINAKISKANKRIRIIKKTFEYPFKILPSIYLSSNLS